MSQPHCFLCRCEDVTLEEFREAYREGFTEIESLKRYTGPVREDAPSIVADVDNAEGDQ